MNNQGPIVIVSAHRSSMGSFQCDFSTLAAHDLGGVALQAAFERAGISPELFNEVLFGNCLMAGQGQGQGQAPARQVDLKDGLAKDLGVSMSHPGEVLGVFRHALKRYPRGG